MEVGESFKMSVMKRKFYQLVLRRTSSFSLAMVVAAMFFERAYDHACEYMFEKINDGVSEGKSLRLIGWIVSGGKKFMTQMTYL